MNAIAADLHEARCCCSAPQRVEKVFSPR